MAEVRPARHVGGPCDGPAPHSRLSCPWYRAVHGLSSPGKDGLRERGGISRPGHGPIAELDSRGGANSRPSPWQGGGLHLSRSGGSPEVWLRPPSSGSSTQSFAVVEGSATGRVDRLRAEACAADSKGSAAQVVGSPTLVFRALWPWEEQGLARHHAGHSLRFNPHSVWFGRATSGAHRGRSLCSYGTASRISGTSPDPRASELRSDRGARSPIGCVERSSR